MRARTPSPVTAARTPAAQRRLRRRRLRRPGLRRAGLRRPWLRPPGLRPARRFRLPAAGPGQWRVPLPRHTGHYQGTGPQPGQYGTGGMPQFDQPGTGPRGPVGGYDQRGTQPPAGPGGYGQGGYDDWEQDQGDDSFLPGFGGRDEFDNGRAGGGAPERDGRYDYDDRRGPRPWPAPTAAAPPSAQVTVAAAARATATAATLARAAGTMAQATAATGTTRTAAPQEGDPLDPPDPGADGRRRHRDRRPRRRPGHLSQVPGQVPPGGLRGPRHRRRDRAGHERRYRVQPSRRGCCSSA